MTFAHKLRLLCPRHKWTGPKARVQRRGFRCICIELNQAFSYGLKAVRRRGVL